MYNKSKKILTIFLIAKYSGASDTPFFSVKKHCSACLFLLKQYKKIIASIAKIFNFSKIRVRVHAFYLKSNKKVQKMYRI